MNSDNGEQSQHEVDQSVPATPSDIELQLPVITESLESHVWKHFTKDPNYKSNKKASCNYCNKVYICSASTTSGILKHLQKVHASKLDHQKANKSIKDI